MEKIILDMDIGVDDAMALLLAFNEPQFEIKMISTVFGNVGVERATKNACFLVEKFGKIDYPVYMGSDKALNNPPFDATDVHGKTGLGAKIVATNVKKQPANYEGYSAIEAMRDYINNEPNEITIVSVGPVTNVARLLMTYPEVAPKIKRVVMEVGSMDGKGSITPYSSFNAYCDPDAVDYVIKSKVPILLTTKEIGTLAYFDEEQRERFKACGKVGPFIYDLCEGYKDKILKPKQYALHDSCALLSLLKTDIFFRSNVDMSIDVTHGKKRAQTKFKLNPHSHIVLVNNVDKQKLIKKMEQIYSRS